MRRQSADLAPQCHDPVHQCHDPAQDDLVLADLALEQDKHPVKLM